MSLTTNADGFRGPVLEKPLQHPILFLGDSFTMGYGVNDGEEFPALIRNALNQDRSTSTTIINAGMGNNGNGRWIKFLEKRAAAYNPRLVVLQVHGNDIADNRRERLFSLTDAGELQELPVTTPSYMRKAQEMLELIPGLANSYLIGLIRQALTPGRQSSKATNQDYLQQDTKLTHQLLEESLNICTRNNWPVILVLTGMPPSQAAEFKAVFVGKTIATITVPDEQQRPDLYYRIDGHWNAAGHQYAAAKLLNILGYNK